eukprot:13745-Heterococcus_DN1.PRE.2
MSRRLPRDSRSTTPYGVASAWGAPSQHCNGSRALRADLAPSVSLSQLAPGAAAAAAAAVVST